MQSLGCGRATPRCCLHDRELRKGQKGFNARIAAHDALVTHREETGKKTRSALGPRFQSGLKYRAVAGGLSVE